MKIWKLYHLQATGKHIPYHSISQTIEKISACKNALKEQGYTFAGNEPLKITIQAKKYGYTGNDLADILREKGIEVEFSDPDYVVMMLTTETTDNDIDYLSKIVEKIEKRAIIAITPPAVPRGKRGASVRDAIFSPCRSVAVQDAEGCILADMGVGCPPAVPIVVSGDIISSEAIECFRYYGIDTINVMRWIAWR